MEPPCGGRAMKRIFISHSTKDVDFVYGQVKPALDQLGFCSWCSATDVRLAADARRRLADLIQGHAPRLGKAMSQLTTQQHQEQTTVISKRREAQVRLRIETADGATREETLKIQNWAIVGRTADADLTLLDDYVSRKHARIAVVPDLHGTRLTLMDLESANGTLLNGAGLATEQPLAIGDRIELGSTRITVLGIS